MNKYTIIAKTKNYRNKFTIIPELGKTVNSVH